MKDDNCNSCESGIHGINRVVHEFGTVKIKQSDKTKPLTVMTITIRVDIELFSLNSTTSFHRILVAWLQTIESNL